MFRIPIVPRALDMNWAVAYLKWKQRIVLEDKKFHQVYIAPHAICCHTSELPPRMNSTSPALRIEDQSRRNLGFK